MRSLLDVVRRRRPSELSNGEIVSQVRDKLGAFYGRTCERAYFRLFGHPIHRRFAVVSAARTGSNYLMHGLQTSPSIRMYHEIFAEHRRTPGKNFDKIMSTLFQYESISTEMVGFKVFYHHLTDEEWQKFVAYKDLKIIHLTRRNRLRTVISREIAFKTGQWTSSGHSRGAREKRIALDPATLVKRLERIEAGEATTRCRFGDRPILEVAYEEMVRSPRDVFDSIGAYLGVDRIQPAKIKLRRQNPETMQQLIENYDEVHAVLANTRFGEYLRDSLAAPRE